MNGTFHGGRMHFMDNFGVCPFICLVDARAYLFWVCCVKIQIHQFILVCICLFNVHNTGGWLMSKSFNKRLQTRHTHLIRTIRRGFRFAIHIMLVHLMVAENQPWKGGRSVVSHQRKEFLAPVTIEINIQMKVTACFIHSCFPTPSPH